MLAGFDDLVNIKSNDQNHLNARNDNKTKIVNSVNYLKSFRKQQQRSQHVMRPRIIKIKKIVYMYMHTRKNTMTKMVTVRYMAMLAYRI